MSSAIIITENGVKEEIGKTLDKVLDNNVPFPITQDHVQSFLTLGGRLDPSLECMRLKGGVHAANFNKAITVDDRVTAPYLHMYWEDMKRADRYLEFPIVTSALRPEPCRLPI
eukprot:jgi/Mesvir1/23368/Mv21063-RA.1